MPRDNLRLASARRRGSLDGFPSHAAELGNKWAIRTCPNGHDSEARLYVKIWLADVRFNCETNGEAMVQDPFKTRFPCRDLRVARREVRACDEAESYQKEAISRVASSSSTIRSVQNLARSTPRTACALAVEDAVRIVRQVPFDASRRRSAQESV